MHHAGLHRSISHAEQIHRENNNDESLYVVTIVILGKSNYESVAKVNKLANIIIVLVCWK